MGDFYEVDSSRIRGSYRRAQPRKPINHNSQNGFSGWSNPIIRLQSDETHKGCCLADREKSRIFIQYNQTKRRICIRRTSKTSSIHRTGMGQTICGSIEGRML